tara:strand:+ start:110 stop:424 length:315 start_codon:yes stop_codon:yes gene_type:complete
MAIATNSISLISETASADTVTKPLMLPLKAKGIILEVNGTGSFSVRFESSPNGVDFYGVQEIDPFTGDSMQSLADSINLFKYMRVKIDVDSGGSVHICKLHYTK